MGEGGGHRLELSTRLYLGDCRDVMAEMDANSVDAIVTDPPYGLSFMGKDWDTFEAGDIAMRRNPQMDAVNTGMSRQGGRQRYSDAYQKRQARDMRNYQEWCTGWATEALRVAKPGAHLLAFGGTRTFHRLACAIEDAGWEIRDTVMWVYGQGFPKSLDVSKAIDKAAGAERTEMEWRDRYHDGATRQAQAVGSARISFGCEANGNGVTLPATPAAKQWQGWGTALKPAVENIIVARKPVADGAALSIIVGNLLRLEAQLWLLLHVNTADGSSGSSQNGFEEAFATAQWTVDELLSTRDALCAQTDMSLFESVTNTSLNTVSSWRSIWGEALRHGNTFTIEAATSPIIGLRTLSYSVSALTPQAIIWAAMIQPGSWWSVLPAASVLNVAAMKLSATLERFAVENAIEQGHIPHPDAVDQAVLSRPIIVARKPLQGTVAANVLAWGTGALNIDGCRVGVDVRVDSAQRKGGPYTSERTWSTSITPPRIEPKHYVGRWPSNFIHDGSDEVVGLMPERDGGAFPRAQRTHNASSYSVTGGSLAPARAMGDSGSAARFFYCAKASKADRNSGLDCTSTVKYDVPVGGASCRDVTMGLVESLRRAMSESTVTWHIGESGVSIMGRCPSDTLSTTLTAISRITTSAILNSLTPSLISAFTQDASLETVSGGSRAESVASSSQYPPTTTLARLAESAPGARLVVSQMLSQISDAANWKPATNTHSTVKPTALMRYLCRLVTPPGGVVLDPFMGSGSTGKAAILEGFRFIGIEVEPEYHAIAERRIAGARQPLTLPTEAAVESIPWN